MTSPGSGTGSGDFKMGSAYIEITARDSTGPGLKQVESSAQMARAAISKSFAGLGPVLSPALGPIAEIANGFSNLGNNAEQAGQKASKAMIGLGAGLTAAGATLIMLGAKETAATNQLSVAISNAGQSSSDYASSIEEVVKSQEHFGHSAVDTKNALATLVTITGSTEKATSLMGEAADLAALRHISLGDAATQVGKAAEGTGKLFQQFGIVVGKNANGTKDYTAANAELADKLKGQASAAADTVSGRFKYLGVVTEDLIASYGKVGPAIAATGVALSLVGSVAQIKAANATRASAAANIELVGTQRDVATSAAAEAEVVMAAHSGMRGSFGELAAAAATTDSVIVEGAGAAEAAELSVEATMGPLGWAIAGVGLLLGGLAVAFTNTGGKAKEATLPINDLTTAIINDGLALGEHNRLAVQSQIESAHLDESFKTLGGSAKDLLNAISSPDTTTYNAVMANLKGIVANAKAVDEAYAKNIQTYNDKGHIESVTKNTQAQTDNKNALDARSKTAQDLITQIDKLRGSDLASLEAAQLHADAITNMSAAERAAAAAVGLTTDDWASQKTALDAATAAQQNQSAATAFAVSQMLQLHATFATMGDPTALQTIGASLSAVGTAAQPSITAFQNWQSAIGDLTNGQASVAQANASAAQSVTAAQKNIATVSQQGADSVASAEKAVAASYASGATSIAAAEKKVTDSQVSAQTAQLALTKARADAAQVIKDAIASLSGLGEAETKARTALAHAELDASVKATQAAQDALNTNTTNTPAEAAAAQAIINAQVAKNEAEAKRLATADSAFTVTDAKKNLADVLAANAKTRADAAATVKAGVEGNAAVVAAKKTVVDANTAEKQSVLDLQAATKAATDAETAAVLALSKARQTAADNNNAAAQSEQTAQANLATTEASGATTLSGLTTKINDARDALNAQELAAKTNDNQIKALATTIATGKFDLRSSMIDTGHDKVADDLIDLQRQILIAFDIEKGMDPATAKAAAAAAFPSVEEQRAAAAIAVAAAHAASTSAGNRGQHGTFAAGGPILGVGTGKSDSVPFWGSNGEHVWTAEEVHKAGGHNVMADWRRAVMNGAGGKAAGGEINFDLELMNLGKNLRNSGLLAAPPPITIPAPVTPVGGNSLPATIGTSAAAAQSYALSQLGKYGWNAAQMAPLIALWNIESGWNYAASNGNSGPDSGSAYGIPQSLPGNKMASVAADWRTNPATQITWGLEYIKGRYGNPANAYAFETSHVPYWYDEGGILPPGGVAINSSKKPEAVFTGDQMAKIGGDIINNYNVDMKVDLAQIDDVAKVVRIITSLPMAVRSGTRSAI